MDINMDYSEDDDELSVAVQQFLADDEDYPSFVETARDLREWVAELYGFEDDRWLDEEGETFLPSSKIHPDDFN